MSDVGVRPTNLYDLFERQVGIRPHAPALCGHGWQLSYADLDHAAAHLAARLARHGVRAGQVVGLLLPRSADAVVSMLALLRLGALYLPLDPAHPTERLRFMVEDAAASVVLVQAERAADAAALGPVVLTLQPPGPERPDPVPRERHDLAYMIYTSGSTGRPKGVPIPHAGVVNLVVGQHYCPFGPAETHLMLSSLGFDFSTLEIWGALLSGGRLAIYEPTFVSLHDVARDVRAFEVTTLMLTPSVFNLLVSERLGDLTGLRRVILGGDVPSVRTARAFLAATPGARLTNIYGPTENTVFTTCFTLDTPDFPDGPIPIGRTIPGTQALVMDEDARVVAPGEVGELWLGGVGLTPGYLGRPDLNERMFVRHPLAQTPDGRLYRSGDLARVRPDGELEFLGRRDLQVKLRGHRVELGEIESALRQHPGVREAAVIALPGPRAEDDRELVGYYERPDGADTHPDDLHAHLAARLPSYMRPAVLCELPELPINTNGKLDRQALAARGRPHRAEPAPHAETESAPDPSADPTLASMLDVWRGVLGRDARPDDDFFAVGGTSLLAALLLTRVRDRFGQDLPTDVLFADPTPRRLAAALAHTAPAAPDGLVRLRTGAADVPPLFLLGDPFVYRRVVPHLAAPGEVYALHHPPASVDAVARDALRTLRACRPAGPYRLAGFSFDGLVAFELACLLEAAGEDVEFVGLIDSGTPQMEEMHLLTLPSFWARARGHLRYALRLPRGRRLRHLVERVRVSVAVRTNRQADDPHFHTLLALARPYRPGVLAAPVTLIRASSEDTVLSDPLMGWSGHTSELRVYDVAGLHLDLIRSPESARELGKRIGACLTSLPSR